MMTNVLLATLCLSGTLSTQWTVPISNTVVIGDLYNCRQVAVQRGNILEARMSSNTLVGDRWRVSYFNGSIMRPVGRPYFESMGPRYANYEVGCTVFRFRIDGYGADSLVLENIRPVAGRDVVSQVFVCLIYADNPYGYCDCNLWWWNNNGIIDLRPKDCVYVRLPVSESGVWNFSPIQPGPMHLVGQPIIETIASGQRVQVFKFIGKSSGNQFLRFVNTQSATSAFEVQARIN